MSTVRVVEGEAPRKLPEEIVRRMHEALASLIHEYEYGEPLPRSHTFGWWTPTVAGELRLTIREPGP
jgi:hypothetical protein